MPASSALLASNAGGPIAWKPRVYDPKIASVRTRCLNPLRELRDRGYSVELFDPRRSHRYRAVVYSKLYDDATFREARALQDRGVTIVLDLCDNHFHYPADPPLQQRLTQQLRRMMLLADRWVASTEAMAQVMISEASEPRPLHVIGDAVETENASARLDFDKALAYLRLRRMRRWLTRAAAEGRTGLVWFGVHGGTAAASGMTDLLKIRRLLEDLHREHPIALTVISNSSGKYREAIRPWNVPTHYVEWHPSTFSTALRSHRLAVIPVTCNPFTRCKSNNRLVTALHAGLAVVADSIPSYREFADVCSLDDWELGLRRYLSNPAVRQRDVEAGREIIEQRWTLPRIAEQWRQLFDALSTDV